jgi:hypothetical protein
VDTLPKVTFTPSGVNTRGVHARPAYKTCGVTLAERIPSGLNNSEPRLVRDDGFWGGACPESPPASRFRFRFGNSLPRNLKFVDR